MDAESALIVIDVQNDFCPGGALAVPEGDQCIQTINGLIAEASHVILTQDWHPTDHSSFVANHEGGEPFTTTELDYGTQVLWPTHCVQGSAGAEFHKDLHQNTAELVIRKGFRAGIDSYSAFYENDQKTSTGLASYLKERGFKKLTMVGLATDFCVAWSAIDGVKAGFDVTVVEAGCRAIDMDGSLANAKAAMKEAGVKLV